MLDEVLPLEMETEETDEQREIVRSNYPAVTFTKERVGNHHSVMLSILRGEQAPAVRSRMLKLKGITVEQWDEKEEKVRDLLRERSSEIETAAREKNPSRLHAIMIKIIEEVLKQHYAKKGSAGSKQEDPIQNFCRIH